MLFGRRNTDGKTVLVVDVESGSAGSALVRLSPRERPRLFGEHRVPVPILRTLDAAELARRVCDAAREAMIHGSEVAARLRLHPQAASLGKIEKVALFLGAPWGRPNLAAGRPDFASRITGELSWLSRSFFNLLPSFHTRAGSAVFGLRTLTGEQQALLSVIGDEMTELLTLKDGLVAGHATIPFGLHTVLRTIQTHSGLSEHEARSALRLVHSEQDRGGHMVEPMTAATGYFATEFTKTARNLLTSNESNAVFIIAPEPAGDLFAKALSGPAGKELAELFPDGGAVRRIRALHVAPYFVAHAHNPDLHLMFEALYCNAAVVV